MPALMPLRPALHPQWPTLRQRAKPQVKQRVLQMLPLKVPFKRQTPQPVPLRQLHHAPKPLQPQPKHAKLLLLPKLLLQKQPKQQNKQPKRLQKLQPPPKQRLQHKNPLITRF
jgi:hypothetical protein